MTSPLRAFALTLAMLSGPCVQAAPSPDKPEHPLGGGGAGALNQRTVPGGITLDNGAAVSSFESAAVKSFPASHPPSRNSWVELATGAAAFEAVQPVPGAGHAPPSPGAADSKHFPEPTGLALVGSGLVGIAAARYRRGKVGR